MRFGALVGFGGVLAAAGSCNGTTGDRLVTFSAYASGAPGASQPFTVGGFSVQLTTAKMHIGAAYFDESPPGATGFDSPVCIASGIYAAQVPGPVDVDLLSTDPQEFSVYGSGSADTALSWQIWLTDGDINEANLAHVVDLQGVATRVSDGTEFSFGAVVTVNDNRLPTASDPSQPGLNPICKERIIQVGGVHLTFFPGGTLTMTIDPRGWFNLNLDFSSLPLRTGGSCLGSAPGPTYCIPDTNFATGPGASQGQNLFTGILTGGPEAYFVRYSH
jgi:hypothetical protein